MKMRLKNTHQIKRKNKNMYDKNIVDIKLLKQYNSLLEQENRRFNLNCYSTFNSSYLKNIDDIYLKIMSNKLDELYKDIEKSYDVIMKWFNDYLSNINSLESYLSSDTGIGMINNSIVRNYVDSKIPKLNSFKNEVPVSFKK